MMEKIIQVASGVGSAPTKLAAFDAALFDAGIGDFNLLRMSSVVPAGYRPMVQPVRLPNSANGDRLYVVYATKTITGQGQIAAAGVGWAMAKTTPPWGLFVEHVGESEQAVRDQIELSLNAMVRYRTSVKWSSIKSEIISKTCGTEPICVLVTAVYGSEPWSPDKGPEKASAG